MKRRRRRRGRANCGRALNTTKVLKLKSTGFALETVGQLLPQKERKQEIRSNWSFQRRQENDKVNELRKCGTWKTKNGAKCDSEPQMQFLPSKEKSHQRNIRFSNVENMTLVSKLVPVYEQLFGKGKSGTSFLQRRQMWQAICDAVNSVGNKRRVVHQCKKRFNNIKMQLENKLDQEKHLLGDHAGPSAFQVYYTQYEEELKKVLPTEVIDGIAFFDSDHPQELCSREEAGPSWFTPQNSQMLPMSSRGYPNISEPEVLQRPFYMGHLDEQWSMLPDLGSTFPIASSTVRSMNFSTHHINLQPGHSVDLRKSSPHHSPYTIELPSSENVPHPTRTTQPGYDVHLLEVLKDTQKLFRKNMMHSLNVLHSDVGHLNKCINEGNSIAYKLVRARSKRNSILHQMNIRLGKLAESVEQLANQQQAEQDLLHDFLGRQDNRQSPCTSIRGV